MFVHFINYVYLCIGNLSAAIDLSFLRSNRINYIVTVDSCPLPEIILDLRDIHIKYIQGKYILFYFMNIFDLIIDLGITLG